MPHLYNRKTGKMAYLSDVETPSALASGNFALTDPVTYLYTADGKAAKIASDDRLLLNTLQDGGRIASPAERAQLMRNEEMAQSPIRAAIYGLANEGTLGGIKAALVKTGLASEESLNVLERENPYAYTLGSLAPAAAEIALTVGTGGGAGAATAGPLARTALKASKVLGGAPRIIGELSAPVGAAVAKKVAGSGSGILAKALKTGAKYGTIGAVEGTLYGTGQLLSEHAIHGENVPLNAERFMQSVGQQALLWGAIGGTAGTLIGGTSASVIKAKNRVADTLLTNPQIKKAVKIDTDKIRKNAVLALVGDTGSLRKKLKEEGLEDIAPEAMARLKHPDGKPIFSYGDSLDTVARRLNETQEYLGNQIGQKLDETTAKGAYSDISFNEIFDAIDNHIIKPELRTGDISGQINSIRIDLKKAFSSAAKQASESGDAITTYAKSKNAEEIRLVYPSLRFLHDQKTAFRSLVGTVYKEGSPSAKIIEKTERYLNDLLETSYQSQMGNQQFKTFKDLKDKYWALRALNDAAQHSIDYRNAASASKFFDTASAKAAAAVAAPIAILHHGISPVDLLTTGVASAGAGVLGAAWDNYGKTAFARYLNRSAKMINIDDSIRDIILRQQKIAMDAKSNFGAKTVKTIEYNLRGVGSKTAEKLNVESPGKKERIWAAEQAKKWRATSIDPSSIQSAISDHLGEAAPDTAQSIALRLQTIANYVLGNLPDEYHEPQMTARTIEQLPSVEQTREFIRRQAAIEDPLGVFERLARGEVDAEGLRIVRQLNPELYRDQVQRIVEAMAQRTDALAYTDRIKLALALGPLAHVRSMRPQNVQLLQQSSMMQQSPQNNSAQQQKIQNIDNTIEQMTTGTQKIQGGIE